MRFQAAAWCAALVLGALWAGSAEAAITPAQRKELTEIKKELGKVSALTSKNDLDDAQKLLDESEQKLRKLAKDAGLEENDRLVAPTFNLIAVKRAALDKKQGKDPAGASFTKDVAPILVGKCTKCHNEDRGAGGLKLDSFAGLKQGGSNGQLLVAGNARASQIMARLTASGNGRMPKGGEPLSSAEIGAIANWINAGAKFDGSDEAARLSAKAPDKKPADTKPVEIPRASGDEKVKFTRDIAPFMANLCVGCHSGNNPRGGLSLVSFESMMRGGDSGRVILPGNL
jgi:mono/diheme cytochrome c family protein